jgi:hypothetical protein
MIIDNKRGKAFTQELAREVKNKQIDNEMKKVAADAEIVRG